MHEPIEVSIDPLIAEARAKFGDLPGDEALVMLLREMVDAQPRSES